MNDELKREIRKIALQNAFEHNGQTKDKVVLSKILGTKPDLRSKVSEITSDVTAIVADVNKTTIDEQKAQIEKEFPEILASAINKKDQEKKQGGQKQDDEFSLPPLEGAIQGKVVTRFPPEPNGYPHIGHAKAVIISEEYAKMYDGKLILRFDDTNPENERLEYYAAIRVGLDWLGVKYDKVKNTSDDIELLYQKGLELIDSNNAYLCTCRQGIISKNRREMKPCKCTFADQKQNQQRWQKMFEKYKPGDAIVRFRGNMESENTVMRDPILFRIIESKHPLLGDKYRVWPSYDLAVAIEDSIDGVTHAFRTKEYELRNELYYSILDALKLRKPKMLEFARLEFKGMPVSKRILKPLIEEGKISWYDDPRLPTLEAMKKRGITPQAIRKFTLSLSLTKADTFAPFDALESFNRKIVDKESIRLFMVDNPTKLIVENLPVRNVELPNHPTITDMGKRTVAVDQNLYLSADDAKKLTKDSQVRLMGLGNVRITSSAEDGNALRGQYTGDQAKVDYQKIQWVTQQTSHKLKILIPKQLFFDEIFNEDSLEELKVYAEPHYLELKEGTEIQFVRFGYCRKDSQSQAIFTHK